MHHQWHKLPFVDGSNRLQTACCGKSPAATTTSLKKTPQNKTDNNKTKP